MKNNLSTSIPTGFPAYPKDVFIKLTLLIISPFYKIYGFYQCTLMKLPHRVPPAISNKLITLLIIILR
jgi:hypothetical protein